MATATLHDGTVVDTASEDWRHETEARAILNLQGLERRRAMLAMIEKKRGEAARLRLQKTMMNLHKQRRATQ